MIARRTHVIILLLFRRTKKESEGCREGSRGPCATILVTIDRVACVTLYRGVPSVAVQTPAATGGGGNNDDGDGDLPTVRPLSSVASEHQLDSTDSSDWRLPSGCPYGFPAARVSRLIARPPVVVVIVARPVPCMLFAASPSPKPPRPPSNAVEITVQTIHLSYT